MDVFYGSDEMDLPQPEGIAASWVFIKALCGNTSPSAAVPFGKMSVGPYTGGYPTGYGDRYANYTGRPKRFATGAALLGFSHLCHSGTGAVGYYYNYALTTPIINTQNVSETMHIPTHSPCTSYDESAEPGYYRARFNDVECELTVQGGCAVHRYRFPHEESGGIKVDLSNDGLTEAHGRFKTNSALISLSGNTACAEAIFQGVKLYFALRCLAPASSFLFVNSEITYSETLKIEDNKHDNFGVFFKTKSEEVKLVFSLSPKSMDHAIKSLHSTCSTLEASGFDKIKSDAYEAWSSALSRIKIEADERTKKIFYSNLYHSLVKPCDFSEESFIYDKHEFTTDLMTLWDMYKTQLPLLFTLFPDISNKICGTLLNITDALGFMPNSIGLSSNYAHERQQARMLGGFALLSAYYHGVPLDARQILQAIHRDLYAEDKRDFIQNRACQSHTWTLDIALCCAYAANLAHEVGENELFVDFSHHASFWESVFDKKTGLLRSDSKYYEGSLYNYSFRPCHDMERRIGLAGGKEAFVAALDSFFGYGAEPVLHPQSPGYIEHIPQLMELGRFEGFNNEPDMETPYSYIYADRHDRTCEVVRAGMKYMFSLGPGGLPGNNDSGGLSSCYIWNALGIFPVAGSPHMLIGSPVIENAELQLATGGVFKIEVHGNGQNPLGDCIYVKRAILNGKVLNGFQFEISELKDKGVLELWMST